MPTEHNRRLSRLQVEERATEAEALLSNPVFQEALDHVYSRAIGTLEGADIGSLTASTAHATIKAIRDIRSQLDQFVTDLKMRQKYPVKGESK